MDVGVSWYDLAGFQRAVICCVSVGVLSISTAAAVITLAVVRCYNVSITVQCLRQLPGDRGCRHTDGCVQGLLHKHQLGEAVVTLLHEEYVHAPPQANHLAPIAPTPHQTAQMGLAHAWQLCAHQICVCCHFMTGVTIVVWQQADGTCMHLVVLLNDVTAQLEGK